MQKKLGKKPDEWACVSPDEQGHQPTILLIEDDEDTCLGMTRILVREGYMVRTAANAHDAMGTLRERESPIDVVILDVHLPDVDGTELCGALRKLYPDLPVIICSGEASPPEVARLLELGARRYFQKPIAPDELLATVEAALP
jgi:DNA-binding response OmpR family regulator